MQFNQEYVMELKLGKLMIKMKLLVPFDNHLNLYNKKFKILKN